ncbi:MAG: hypothetical protein DWQ37_09525 [Planctomycetota bacterium]|nr:MAG: hypothetical protein DWQ37_09525 [Planctomycetota bacterium]
MEKRRPFFDWVGRWGMLPAMAVLVGAGLSTIFASGARAYWRFELLCHFRVQYFWALTAAAVFLWIARRRLAASTAAVLAAANLALILPLYFGPGPHGNAGPAVRALSLNVYLNNPDHAATLELILREQPDIVYLMEVSPRWSETLEALAADYPHRKLILRWGTDGVALLSRFAFRGVEVRGLPGGGLPTLVAEVAAPGGDFTLIAAHPASPGSRQNVELRNRQFVELAELAQDRAGPVMILGDLNSTGWSPYFGRLIEDSGLADSRQGFGVEPTWPRFPLPLRIPIDHCLASPEISIVDRRVGPSVGSDHRPLLVDFALPER